MRADYNSGEARLIIGAARQRVRDIVDLFSKYVSSVLPFVVATILIIVAQGGVKFGVTGEQGEAASKREFGHVGYLPSDHPSLNLSSSVAFMMVVIFGILVAGFLGAYILKRKGVRSSRILLLELMFIGAPLMVGIYRVYELAV